MKRGVRKEKQCHATTTPKAPPHHQMRGSTFSVPQEYSAPGTSPQISAARSRTTPAPVQTCPNGQDLDTKAPFLLTVNGRLSSPKSRRFAAVGSDTRLRAQSFRRNRKENGGSFPRRKAAQSPVPAPWAGHPVPARRRTLSASLKEKQGPCPCAAQRHIVPRLTARRPWRPLSAWDTHLLHF